MPAFLLRRGRHTRPQGATQIREDLAEFEERLNGCHGGAECEPCARRLVAHPRGYLAGAPLANLDNYDLAITFIDRPQERKSLPAQRVPRVVHDRVARTVC